MPSNATPERSRHSQSPSAAESDSDREAESHAAGSKRRRAILACERCKARKQRCVMDPETNEESCLLCLRSGSQCIMPHKTTTARFRSEMVSSLENRIALLESRLAELVPEDPLVADHLARRPGTRACAIEKPDAVVAGVSISSQGARSSGDDSNEYAAGVGLLSLNAASEPHYLGASSGYFWTKLVGSTFHGHHPLSLFRPAETFRWRGESKGEKDDVEIRKASPPGDPVSETLFNGFYQHIQARYPFLDWVRIKGWMRDRKELLVSRKSYHMNEQRGRSKGVASFFIWMIYAIGALLLRAARIPGVDAPETYYAAAIEHLEAVLAEHRLENVQAFLMLAMYSIRCSECIPACHLTALSMSLAVEMGLHRKRPSHTAGPATAAEELRKRVWWTIYSLDRLFALQLGRPLGIADSDFDQDLPSERAIPTDETESTEGSVEEPGFTNMSSAIHVIRLRRILSRIQTQVFALNVAPAAIRGAIESLTAELDGWQATMPRRPSDDTQNLRTPCCSEDWFASRGDAARLIFLRPVVRTIAPTDDLLTVCASAAARLCETHRRLHQRYPFTSVFSLTDLHDIFLTGLTLLFCLHRRHDVVPFNVVNKAVRACSSTLFVYAQHIAAAEPFRDSFEMLAEATLDLATQSPQTTSPQHDGPQAKGQVDSWLALTNNVVAHQNTASAQDDFVRIIQSFAFSRESEGPNQVVSGGIDFSRFVAPENTQQGIALAGTNATSNAVVASNEPGNANVDIGSGVEWTNINYGPHTGAMSRTAGANLPRGGLVPVAPPPTTLPWDDTDLQLFLNSL